MSNTTAKIRAILTAKRSKLADDLAELDNAIASLDTLGKFIDNGELRELLRPAQTEPAAQAPELPAQEVRAQAEELPAQAPVSEVRRPYKGPEPRTQTYRELVTAHLAAATDWLNIAAIAEGVGLTQKQVTGVVSNNPKDFERTSRFGLFCYSLKGKGFPIQYKSDEPVPPPAPFAVPTVSTPKVDETDEQARDRIYAFVELNGIARPAGLALNLSIDLDRVTRLLEHPWFTRNPHGYAIAKVNEQ